MLAGTSGGVAAQVREPAPVPAGRVPPRGTYEPGFDALHYDIAITLPDGDDVMRGRARIDVAIVEPATDTLRLDLVGLRVSSARVGVGAARSVETGFRVGRGRVYLPVPDAAHVGDTLHVDIDYDGTPDDGLIIRRNVHGERSAFADDWPDRARFWFPGIDHPSDKATVSFEVRAPEGWEVVSNGPRSDGAPPGSPPADGVWRFSVPVPIPTYTMVVGAADFTVVTVDACADGGSNETRPDRCVPVTYWSFPQDSARAARVFRRAGDMIAYYSRTFGPYPFAKLAHVQSATRFGGMENVGAIFYSEEALANGSLDEVTVAHETTHQWFGDAVTEADWSHLWLSEGFATYFSMQFFEHAEGEAAFRALLTQSAREYLASGVTDLAMVDTTAVPGNDLFSLLNANSYNKGGQVLHMLRGVLGDSLFFAGIRRYFATYRYRTALTRDFERVMEQTSGRDLGWFFDEWAYRPGYPVFKVSSAWDPDASDVVVTVDQTQKASWPAFRMPIDFAFDTPQGEVRRRAEVSGRHSEVRFSLPAPPTAVRLDPDGWVLKRMDRQ